MRLSRQNRYKFATNIVASCAIITLTTAAFSQNNSDQTCSAQSGPFKTPVIELYTSEGCSSCPPADQWLTALKTKSEAKTPGTWADNPPVLQAFHVGYWDYIGWVDRFATPAHTTRQRQIAAWNRQSSIYTPQLVHNGRDWRDWYNKPAVGVLQNAAREPSVMAISLKRVGTDQYEAVVTPWVAGAPTAAAPSAAPLPASWSAYWTLTEDGHSSKVKSGENAGEFLKHDAVVRQYTAAGDYRSTAGSAQKLSWRSIAATPGHPRRVNLVVFDSQTGRTLQAVSAPC